MIGAKIIKINKYVIKGEIIMKMEEIKAALNNEKPDESKELKELVIEMKKDNAKTNKIIRFCIVILTVLAVLTFILFCFLFTSLY